MTGPAAQPKNAPAIVATGRWIGSAERPLMGWLTRPEATGSHSGALILPPVGYPYWSSHRTLRVIAEQIAADGHLALRLDYDGTGDSAGDGWDPDRLAAWRTSVRAGADELRRLGCRRLVLVGARVGATLALLDGAELGADLVIAWEPVTSGRRYAREVRLLAAPVPAEHDPTGGGALVSAGTVFSAQTLADLSGIALMAITVPPAARITLVGAAPDAKIAEHFAGLGCEVEWNSVPGGPQALEAPTEEAVVPEGIVEAVRQRMGRAEPDGLPPGEAPARTRLTSDGVALTEEVVMLGADRLVGILTAPEEPRPSGATAVFLNTGSEAHVGPGRAWVEYARRLATLGHRSLRVDFRGWGESPDEGHAPGRPYDAHCQEDTVAIIHALRERGHERIVLVGLCASAWVALRVVLREPVTGVIALNPQLYWRPGDPVEAMMATTRIRRTPERRREELGGHWGLWTALDRLGHRPWAGRWLDELCAAEVPILMLFAAGDDGLEYLGNRLARRWERALRSGAVRVTEIPDIDHAMHRAWLRTAIADALHEQLVRLEA